MSGRNRQGDNDETRGIEAPGPIDRLLDRDRDDKADILEGGADRTTTRGARREGEVVTEGTEGEIRVPVAEERLKVGKRETELGEVDIRKTVTEEEQTVPVTLRRDEVNVREVDVAERPLRDGDDAFNEGTIRVPVRGEEAVVSKEAVVTGEVVVEKDTTAQEQQVSGTVRRQRVDVDKAYQEARSGFQQDFDTYRGSATDEWSRGRTFEQAEPHYQSGFSAGHDERYSGQSFEQVEPTLRSEYESRSGATRTGTSTGTGGDSWEQLRREVRQGWDRARNR